MLGGVFVGRPRPETAVSRETQQRANVVDGAPNRKATSAFGLEPALHAVQLTRAIVVQRRGAHDGVVQDRQDGAAVLGKRAFHEPHGAEVSIGAPRKWIAVAGGLYHALLVEFARLAIAAVAWF